MSKGELLEIKRRIKSIQNTQKITKAMGLVATAKFKRIRENAEYVKVLSEATKDTFEKTLCEESVYTKYFTVNDANSDLYVIITSNTGLCGNYNSSVINSTLEFLKNEDRLITIGDRGSNFFKRRGFNIVKSFQMSRVPIFEEASDIFNIIEECFLQGKVKNAYIVYTRFINPVRQEIEKIRLLPFTDIKKNKDILMEPSNLQVFEHSARYYLITTIFDCLSSSLASEYAMRMTAMDNATKNSGELLEKLQLKYNRIRQSSITQEVTEIVSGAEALNSQ
ncbi:ATP synthase gamma chain [Caloramator mitchellensis]|uniref:ATP synthase gamma chain n=1 Tax=Caloramator mitchellensis TaxID=908809 RepID=A0A0R3JW27_CALMK|nr:ATP synthase F1 subunit gamma [Caloramator mitchellensis]KRQ87736.1 ATP synthase gamma chain [Caloramator mitchellensis]